MLGHTLKRLRKTRGLTQVALAHKAGITDVYLSLLETGAKRNPSLVVLQRLAKALGVSVGDLISLSEKGRTK